MNQCVWLEEQTPTSRTQWQVKRVLLDQQTPFQHLQVFPITLPYLAVVPTYPSGLHCFMMGFQRHHPVRGGLREPAFAIRWYSPTVHRVAFTLPPVVAELAESPAAAASTNA